MSQGGFIECWDTKPHNRYPLDHIATTSLRLRDLWAIQKPLPRLIRPRAVIRAKGGEALRAALFMLMRQRFCSTEVAGRITDRIVKESKHGEQHVRDYLRKNLEFTRPAIDEIADILFCSK